MLAGAQTLNSAMSQPEGVIHSDPAVEAENDELHSQMISGRVRRKPNCLQEYITTVNCTTATNPVFTSPHLSNTFPLVFNFKLNVDLSNFLANITMLQEPKAYIEAKQSNKWIQAMNAEIAALERNRHGF